MQVLSQLSYNPTVGPLIGAIPDARPVRFGLTARRASSASPIAGSHLARLAVVEAYAYCSRFNAFRASIPAYLHRRPRQLMTDERWRRESLQTGVSVRAASPRAPRARAGAPLIAGVQG